MSNAHQIFGSAAQSPVTGPDTREAEAALRSWGIEFTKRADGFLEVEDLDISYKGLTKLPDLTCVVVNGNFDCSLNKLTTLEGAPQSLKGDFICSGCQLTNLSGCPQNVGGHFNCSDNRLTTLTGAPKTVSGDFSCAYNQLTTLTGAPQTVGRDFECHDNQLNTLIGAPQTVGGYFECDKNKLTTLYYISKTSGKIYSDLGNFDNSAAIPPKLLKPSQEQIDEIIARAIAPLPYALSLNEDINIKRRPRKKAAP
jgi:hypothetical protein